MKKKTAVPSRKEIWKMFDEISPTYDRVNRVMTFGLDQHWRKRLSSYLPKSEGLRILDCATGTGDQIVALMRVHRQVSSVVGIDLSEAMVEIAKTKIAKTPYADKVALQVASALEVPFDNASFDAVTISFGIRNVTDVLAALKEFHRVLTPGGRALILEGTVPEGKALKAIHLFYLRHLLPRIGGLISKRKDAYRYLNETIETFPQGEAFLALMRQAGFARVRAIPLFGGVTTVYTGDT